MMTPYPTNPAAYYAPRQPIYNRPEGSRLEDVWRPPGLGARNPRVGASGVASQTQAQPIALTREQRVVSAGVAPDVFDMLDGTQLDSIETLPKFAQMPYKDQLEVRSAWARVNLPDSPQWLSADTPEAREQLWNQVVYRPPVFEGEVTPAAQQWLDAAQRIETGERVPAAEVFLREFTEGSSLFGAATTLATKFADWIGADDVAQTAREVGGIHDTRDDKAYEYFRTVASLSDHEYRGADLLGGLTSSVMDMISGRMIAAPIMGGIRGQRVAAEAANAGFFRARLLPEVLESSVDVIGWNTASLVSGRMREQSRDPNTRVTVGEFAAHLGRDFLTDFALAAGLQVLGASVQGVGRVFGRGALNKEMYDYIARTTPPSQVRRSAQQEAARRGLNAEQTRQYVGEQVHLAHVNAGDEALQELLTGQSFDSVRRTLPLSSRRIVDRARAKFAAARMMLDGTANPTQIADVFSTRAGYDMRVLHDGRLKLTKITDDLPGPKTQMFDSVRDVTRWSVNHVASTVKNAAKTGKESVIGGFAANDITLVDRFTAQLGKITGMEPRVALQLLTPDVNSGRLSKFGIRQITDSIVKHGGPDGITQVKVRMTDTFDSIESMFNRRSDGVLEVLVPTRIQDPVAEIDFAARYLDEIAPYAGDPQQALHREALENAVYEGGLAGGAFPSYSWLDAEAKRLGGQGIAGNMHQRYRLPGITDQTFRTADEVRDYLSRRSLARMNPDELGTVLEREYGLKLTKSETTGEYQAKRIVGKNQGMIDAHGRTTDELLAGLAERGYVLRGDVRQAADIIIDPEANTISFTGNNIIRGPNEHVMEYMRTYRGYTGALHEEVLERVNQATIKMDTITHTYRVEAPELNVKTAFETFDEAKKFLSKNFTEYQNLKDLAYRKGIRISYGAGGWMTELAGDPMPQVFTNSDDLVAYIRSTKPTPEWVKELTGLDDAGAEAMMARMNDGFLDMGENLKPPSTYQEIITSLEKTTGKPVEVSPFRTVLAKLNTLVAPAHSGFQRLADAGVLPKEWVNDIFEAGRKQAQNAMGYKRAVDEFVAGTYKTLDEKSLEKLTLFLQTPEKEWATKLIGTLGDLTPNERVSLDATRKFFDQMGTLFGVDTYKWINEYVPHIRTALKTDPNVVKMFDVTPDAHKAIRSVLGDEGIREVDFFATHLKTTEFRKYLEINDISRLVSVYAEKGIKNLTLGAWYRESLSRLDRDVAKGLITDPDAIRFTFKFMQDSMGLGTNLSDEMVRGATRAMSTGIADALSKRGLISMGRKEAIEATADIVSVFHRLSVGALMAGRTFLSFRNMHQIFTSFGSMVGMDDVLESAHRVLKPEIGQPIFEKLVRQGRVSKQAPLFGVKLAQQRTLDRALDWGMRAYGNSDTFTRMVVEDWTQRVGRRELSALQAGSVDVDTFLGRTAIRKLASTEQADILSAFKQGDSETVLDKLSDYLTRETMFDYTATSGAEIFDGMLGRMFGMYGHYSSSMASHYRNMLTRGTWSDRLAFAARAAGISAALAVGYKQLGIRSDSFRPEKALIMTGGPYYQLMNDTLQALAGAPGAKSLKSLAEDAAMMTIPFGLAGRGIVQGVKAIAEGRVSEGMLYFLSAPVEE